jgi:hypothetical protein
MKNCSHIYIKIFTLLVKKPSKKKEIFSSKLDEEGRKYNILEVV